jgi:hypothetical protein
MELDWAAKRMRSLGSVGGGVLWQGADAVAIAAMKTQQRIGQKQRRLRAMDFGIENDSAQTGLVEGTK